MGVAPGACHMPPNILSPLNAHRCAHTQPYLRHDDCPQYGLLQGRVIQPLVVTPWGEDRLGCIGVVLRSRSDMHSGPHCTEAARGRRRRAMQHT